MVVRRGSTVFFKPFMGAWVLGGRTNGSLTSLTNCGAGSVLYITGAAECWGTGDGVAPLTPVECT